ncbi:PDR/VanB family oxidoreductase [Amycolatopsis alkalitolerans]|uniref:Oxidoreductase n=1 Tax=Amycolatopsis alkalitolerans TaxID=2547244 RepID=A0A5C4LQN4_9PSEU|nr:PDR/VanB family oxidoreductase [Amycolatopsis alkalitolerans]TNC18815.1 oxidoreductase [Amycolatopsis alkalitolerans]
MTTVDLRIVDKASAADGVVTLTLAHPRGNRLPDWAPGAHVDLVLPGGLVRQYSLCGDRYDPRTYRVAVLREPHGRGGSAFVHDELSAGDTVSIGGPRNNFPLVPAGRYLFIAGGIGITPLLPMVRQAELLGADWRLLYGGRSRASMAFLDELDHERVTVRPQDEYGLLDLGGWLGEPDWSRKVYCCGPEPLLAAVENRCAGWPAGLLRTERFVPAEQGAPVRAEPFEVAFARAGGSVRVQPGQSILDAAAAAGLNVLSSCRHGTCGTCETGVLEGIPEHRDSILDDAERAAGDCMFVCVSRSRTDRLVLDL